METKKCPECGKRMIHWHGGNMRYAVHYRDLPGYDLVGTYWRCGCGHCEDDDGRRALTEDELFEAIWAFDNKEGT